MAILTVDQLREHVTSSLGDDALQRLLDAAETEIVEVAGEPGASLVEQVDGGIRKLSLSRRAGSITSIAELVGTTSTGMDATDYRLRAGGYIVERLATGINPRHAWSGFITVTYVPVDDSALREAVQIDLVKLGLNSEPGASQETIGSWSESRSSSAAWNAGDERAAILARLRPEPGVVVVR